MKKVCLMMFVLFVCLSACKKAEFNNKVDDSYKKWVAFKQQHNNSYSYIAYNSSVFGGYSETKITVTNGKVTARDYLMGIYKPNTTILDIKVTWVENEASLNTHPNSAADVLSLDQIYTKARTVWLKADKKNNDVYFEANNNGILSEAGYVPHGCQDDCFNGIHIKEVSPL